MDGKSQPPPEIVKAWRIDWLGGAATLGAYDDLDERELYLMMAGKNYYEAYETWTNSDKGALAESNPGLTKLAWEVEALKMTAIREERIRLGKNPDMDDDLLEKLGLDAQGNLK